MQRTMTYLFVFTLILTGLLTPATPAVFASDTSVQETPTPLIFSGVTRYTLTAPKLFWYSGVPDCPPKVAAATAPTANTGQYTELIRRVATYGSSTRTLYSESRDCNQNQLLSNLVADADYLYWLGAQGLMRLSTNANPGDQPELVNALVKAPGEVADGGDRIYVISTNTGGSNTEIAYVRKDNQQKVPLGRPGNSASDLSSDGQYVYYKVNSDLIRLDPGVDSGIVIANKVRGYYAEGRRLSFCTIKPIRCFFSNNVYVGIGNRIFVYDNNNSTLGASPIYTSSDTSALIDSLVTDFSKLFFYEERTDACGDLFCNQSYVLMRTARGGGAADALYTFGPTVSAGPSHLTTDGTYLFWQENERVQRLANDAAALPQINLRVTGLEVTQGIQNTSNSVLLVQNRRTFVRLYVKSDGAAVSGVGATLAAPGLESSVQPVNPAGTHLTVRANPNRNDINQSFLFELPWNWTQGASLTLHAILNPYKIPLEPNYGDNDTSITINFKPSPTLSVEFFRLNYTIGGTTYRPRISEDVLKTYSWILRAYPLGGAMGANFKPRLWDVDGGTRLGSWVNRSSGDCTKSKIHDSDLALCASYYTNGWLWYYRIATIFGALNVGLNPNSFYYGMISDASNNFPRGQAAYPLTSVGPSGTPGQFFSLGQGWDSDGSYADWYAGHEIGHSLGRAHPSASAALCGNSASDPGYPYPNGQIGPNDGSMEGFDVGDPPFGIAKAVYPGTQWYDVMSYCSNQWISDYT